MARILFIIAMAAALAACVMIDGHRNPDGTFDIVGSFDGTTVYDAGFLIGMNRKAMAFCPDGYQKLAEATHGDRLSGTLTWTIRCQKTGGEP